MRETWDPWSGRPPVEGNGYPLEHSGLENPMDRGAWQATVHVVAESDTTERFSLSFSDFWFCLKVLEIFPSVLKNKKLNWLKS